MAEQQTNGRIRVSPSVVAQVVAWLVAALLTYGAINARVAVVEDRVNAIKEDLSEIRADVKQLLRKP